MACWIRHSLYKGFIIIDIELGTTYLYQQIALTINTPPSNVYSHISCRLKTLKFDTYPNMTLDVVRM